MIYLKQEKEKDVYWSVIRGICIICVVCIHATIPLDETGNIVFSWYIFKRIIAFPVAFFFTLAGYFVHLDECNNWKYIIKKLERIIVPYSILSLLYIFSTSHSSKANIKGAFASLILGTAEVQMYFLLYLMQMILLLPFLTLCVKKTKLSIITITVGYCISIGWSLMGKEYFNILPAATHGLCFGFLCYYYLGLYLKNRTEKNGCEINKSLISSMICLASLSLILSIIEGYRRGSTAQITLPNYLYSSSLILCVFFVYNYFKSQDQGALNTGVMIENNKMIKIIAYIGDNSFFIYLTHVFILRWGNNNFVQFRYPMQQLFEVFFAVTIPLCVVTVIPKIIGKIKELT